MRAVPLARPGSRLALCLLVLAAVTVLGPAAPASAQPGPGEVVIAWHVTIAPTWFDPSTAPPQITPFGMLYALHDALVRPLPGQRRWRRASPSRGRRAPTASRTSSSCAADSSSTTATPSPPRT